MAHSALATPAIEPQRQQFNAVPEPEPIEPIEPTEPQVIEPTVTPANDAEAQAEAEALPHGWMGKEDWIAAGRPPERWKPASEFLDIRRNIQSVLKDENAGLRAKVAALELAQRTRDQATTEARHKLSQAELVSQMRQAAEDQDWAKHAELTDKLTDLKAEARSTTAPQSTATDPDVQTAADEFRNARENQPIFRDKQLARTFATQLKLITSVDPNLSAADALKEAKDVTMRLYPERFRNTNRQRPGMVETTGTTTSAVNGKTWADLTPEYQAQAVQDIKAKKYTQAEFLTACADQPEAWRH